MTPGTSSFSAFRRFGGALPAGCDTHGNRPAAEPPCCLYFSNVRAALAWFIDRRGPFDTALISAYTCPSVPTFLANRGLKLRFFDHDAEPDLVEITCQRCLVLVPTIFGLYPTTDIDNLARALPNDSALVIDAAQTAFGHLDYAAPSGGAVVSGPRKTLGISDGAVLTAADFGESDTKAVDALPAAITAATAVAEARSLLARRDITLEGKALDLLAKAESAFSELPCRMSRAARAELAMIDRDQHHAVRRRNFERLHSRLGHLAAVQEDRDGTPFCLPILADNRNNVLSRLHAARVFATPLWPNAVHDPVAHPVAADLTKRLIALPVDQRYTETTKENLADIVEGCL